MNNWNNHTAVSLSFSAMYSSHSLQSYLQNVNRIILLPSLKSYNGFPLQILTGLIETSPWSCQSLFHLRLFVFACFSALNALPQDLHMTGSFLSLMPPMSSVWITSIHLAIGMCLRKLAKVYQN